MEGLSSHSPEASRFIMPLSVLVLLILFGIQRFGTGMVGKSIATKLVQLGHHVMMGSRTADNANAAEWAAELGVWF